MRFDSHRTLFLLSVDLFYGFKENVGTFCCIFVIGPFIFAVGESQVTWEKQHAGWPVHAKYHGVMTRTGIHVHVIEAGFF